MCSITAAGGRRASNGLSGAEIVRQAHEKALTLARGLAATGYRPERVPGLLIKELLDRPSKETEEVLIVHCRYPGAQHPALCGGD